MRARTLPPSHSALSFDPMRRKRGEPHTSAANRRPRSRGLPDPSTLVAVDYLYSSILSLFSLDVYGSCYNGHGCHDLGKAANTYIHIYTRTHIRGVIALCLRSTQLRSSGITHFRTYFSLSRLLYTLFGRLCALKVVIVCYIGSPDSLGFGFCDTSHLFQKDERRDRIPSYPGY